MPQSLAPTGHRVSRDGKVIDVGDGGGELRDTFVLHSWQPADNAGVVAVAYPASYIHTRQPDDAATALLERIDVSAVALPDGTRDILPNGELGEINRASGWPIDRAPSSPKDDGPGLTSPQCCAPTFPGGHWV